jgi:hypothetical protein
MTVYRRYMDAWADGIPTGYQIYRQYTAIYRQYTAVYRQKTAVYEPSLQIYRRYTAVYQRGILIYRGIPRISFHGTPYRAVYLIYRGIFAVYLRYIRISKTISRHIPRYIPYPALIFRRIPPHIPRYTTYTTTIYHFFFLLIGFQPSNASARTPKSHALSPKLRALRVRKG